MADAQTQPARRGGGFSKLILWLLVLGLLAAVWWLASERNLRRFAWRVDGQTLIISKGRFFPLGMASIAGDDSQLCVLVRPALTALARDIQAYGRHTARVLRQVMDGQSPGSQPETATRLVVRASTAAPPP